MLETGGFPVSVASARAKAAVVRPTTIQNVVFDSRSIAGNERDPRWRDSRAFLKRTRSNTRQKRLSIFPYYISAIRVFGLDSTALESSVRRVINTRAFVADDVATDDTALCYARRGPPCPVQLSSAKNDIENQLTRFGSNTHSAWQSTWRLLKRSRRDRAYAYMRLYESMSARTWYEWLTTAFKRLYTPEKPYYAGDVLNARQRVGVASQTGLQHGGTLIYFFGKGGGEELI